MHDHAHGPRDLQISGDRRIGAAVAVNLGLTVVQVAGGILAGSLALIADALHNFSDAVALMIAFGARRIARRPADARMTFGYGRAEVVAALVNYTVLVVIGLWLAVEAVRRFFDPQPVDGWPVVWIALVALVIDLATAALLMRDAKTSVNLRAAFLHNLADALSSVAVILAGVAVILWGWNIVDPAITLLIAAYILWHSLSDVGEVIRLLMLGTPDEIDPDAVVDAIRAVPGVADVHHVHLWEMQEHVPALDAHLVVAASAGDGQAVKAEVKALLARRFGIGHVTLDLESEYRACVGPRLYGHG